MAGEYSRSRFYPRDSWTLLRGRIAFTGAAGLGAIGTFNVAVTTGDIEIQFPIGIKCTEDLESTTGTLLVGVTAVTNFFIYGPVTATTIGTGEWFDYSGGSFTAGIGSDSSPHHFSQLQLSTTIFGTVASADITDGQLDFFIWWRPLSADGKLELGPNLVAI